MRERERKKKKLAKIRFIIRLQKQLMRRKRIDIENGKRPSPNARTRRRKLVKW